MNKSNASPTQIRAIKYAIGNNNTIGNVGRGWWGQLAGSGRTFHFKTIKALVDKGFAEVSSQGTKYWNQIKITEKALNLVPKEE